MKKIPDINLKCMACEHKFSMKKSRIDGVKCPECNGPVLHIGLSNS